VRNVLAVAPTPWTSERSRFDRWFLAAAVAAVALGIAGAASLAGVRTRPRIRPAVYGAGSTTTEAPRERSPGRPASEKALAPQPPRPSEGTEDGPGRWFDHHSDEPPLRR
jgi:hypothetical protein